MVKVRSYNEYLNLLEAEIKRNGYKKLSILQINSFITNNRLDSEWGVVVKDVEKDCEIILKRFNHIAWNNTSNNNTPARKRLRAKTVASYADYMDLLRKEVKINGNKRLSPMQIHKFIRYYDLKEDWNIEFLDVSKDLDSIFSSSGTISSGGKIENGANLSHSPYKTQKSGLTSKNNSSIANSSRNNSIELSATDKGYAKELVKVFQKYNDIGDDPVRWKGVLSDIFPNKRIEINLLSFLVDEGILGALEECDSINVFLYSRYVELLKNNYGTDEDVAKRIVAIWVYSYGIEYLNKKMEKW